MKFSHTRFKFSSYILRCSSPFIALQLQETVHVETRYTLYKGKGCYAVCRSSAEGRNRYSSTHNRGAGWSAPRPGRFTPGRRKTLYPFYMKQSGLQDRSGWVLKMSPPPGFKSRTVQFVASRYTDSLI